MLQLTEKAKDKIKFFIQDRSPLEWGIQIRSQGGPQFHLSLIPLNPLKLGDFIIDQEGFKFVIDEDFKEKLEGATIDFVDTAWSSGFRVELIQKASPVPQKTNLDESIPQVQKIQNLFRDEINPALASHGGFVELLDYKDHTAYIHMGGGCQGCASSQATLRQGIELRLREEVPEIVEIVDQTNHAAGKNPYFHA